MQHHFFSQHGGIVSCRVTSVPGIEAKDSDEAPFWFVAQKGLTVGTQFKRLVAFEFS